MKHWLLLLFFVPVFVFAESLHSPTWGFSLDLPEGCNYIEGNGKDRFSFSGLNGLQFDLAVYNGAYKSIEELAADVNRRLENQGDTDLFNYRNKQAAIIELSFGNSAGWGLCVELAGSPPPMLLALSYAPANRSDLELFHLSALDSIVPSAEERYYPGPVTEYSYPRGEQKQVAVANSGVRAMIHENDAEAAQVLIEREFKVLENYLFSGNWREAWVRYYRFIYRDSRGRIADAASALALQWNEKSANSGEAKMALAKKALAWVQGFKYERYPQGSDFLNLVSAITQGRGNCDSHAMLWAIILGQADIRAAIMVSRQHSHAMGLADLAGTGARFEAHGTKWLVAETTANVDIGLIAQDISDSESWLGVIFE